jgi:MFS superfamily sulfate permease-like transporter
VFCFLIPTHIVHCSPDTPHRYIFFGSCNQIINWTKNLIAENNLQPNCKQLRYVTIDFKNVENIDYTGASSFRDIVDVLSDAGCDVLFSGCSKKSMVN